MKSAGKARSNGLYRHIRTSKEIIRNLLNDYNNSLSDILYIVKSQDTSPCNSGKNSGNHCTNNFGSVLLFRNHFYIYPFQSPK